jgi:type II secretory pathway component GspD/PulD (secretin)
VVKKLLSSQGSVIEDFRTNSLIVQDIPSRMSVITQAIAALDVSVPQVMLEVEILDVSKNAVDQLGIKFPNSLAQLDMTTTARMTRFPFGNKGTSGNGWTMQREDATVGGWTVDEWPASKFGPTIFSVINTQLAFDFLRTQSDTKYLARPRILTLNNEPAEIKIVTNEAIGLSTEESSTAGGSMKSSGAERVYTGVSLRVIPQINVDNGEITMFIYPAVSQANTGGTFGGTTFKDPEIRSTKCLVRVKDAETIVIGGLILNDFSETRTRVPILGDIPLLGGLFRHKNKDKGKERELLVFITPHILKESAKELAGFNKARLPEREQESAIGINRQEAISSSLNTFDKTSY